MQGIVNASFRLAARARLSSTGTSLNMAFWLVPDKKSEHRARARALPPGVVLGTIPGHRNLSEHAVVSSLVFSHAFLWCRR